MLQLNVSLTENESVYTVYAKLCSDGWVMKQFDKDKGLSIVVTYVIAELGAWREHGWKKRLPPMAI